MVITRTSCAINEHAHNFADDEGEDNPVQSEANHLVGLGREHRIAEHTAAKNFGAAFVTEGVVNGDFDNTFGCELDHELIKTNAVDLVIVNFSLTDQVIKVMV